MIPTAFVLLQTGATLAEHNADIYPVIGWLIVSLLSIIGVGIVFLIGVLKARLQEFKDAQDKLLDTLNSYIVGSERRFGRNEARISVLEHEVGIPIAQERDGGD